MFLWVICKTSVWKLLNKITQPPCGSQVPTRWLKCCCNAGPGSDAQAVPARLPNRRCSKRQKIPDLKASGNRVRGRLMSDPACVLLRIIEWSENHRGPLFFVDTGVLAGFSLHFFIGDAALGRRASAISLSSRGRLFGKKWSPIEQRIPGRYQPVSYRRI